MPSSSTPPLALAQSLRHPPRVPTEIIRQYHKPEAPTQFSARIFS